MEGGGGGSCGGHFDSHAKSYFSKWCTNPSAKIATEPPPSEEQAHTARLAA